MQAKATLQLAGLDPYHARLVPMMLDMLRPRLSRAWQAVERGDADAVLVDIASQDGLRLALERSGAGLATRTIGLGEDAVDAPIRMLHKPLRLHALLEALSQIEVEAPAADAPRQAWADSAHYRLRHWPALDPASTGSDRIRILAQLERRAQSVPELARRLGLHETVVQLEVATLLREGVLAPASSLPPPAPPDAPRPPPIPHRLVAMLRQRFGL